jgi:hypothetical protein
MIFYLPSIITAGTLPPVEVTDRQMMLLHDAGLISDNSSCWEEVAECDRTKALQFLAMVDEMNPTPKRIP